MPLRYEDRRFPTDIASLEDGRPAVVLGVVVSAEVRPTKRRSVRMASVEIEDGSGAAGALFFGGFRLAALLKPGTRIILSGVPTPSGRTRKHIPSLEFKNPEYELLLGDAAKAGARWGRILPVYPSTEGLPRSTLAEIIRSCAASPELVVEDPVPREITVRRGLMPLRDAFTGIHSPSSLEEIEAARRRAAYQEFWDIQAKSAAFRAERACGRATPLAAGDGMLERFRSSLPFALTPSQELALSEVSGDLNGAVPMRRLLMGDVGSGKTVVAAAAIAKCAGASMQAAVLAPTTILSSQFYEACHRLLSPLGITTAEIFGKSKNAMSASEREKLEFDLKSGAVGVLVGTHALLGDSIAFKSLGLLVIDEQHRFGVSQRRRLLEANAGAHVLMMSATPIPRTLSMALYGDIDVSEIREMPQGRKGVKTRVMSDNHIGELYSFMADRVIRSGFRCYWVCPSIGGDSPDEEAGAVLSRARDVERNIPGVPVTRLHGAMPSSEKRDALRRFKEGDPGVMVSTTVIEVGVDVPDAVLMVIEGAARYGLAALHQMRGRVGRGSRAGICVLLDSAANIRNSRKLRVLLECCDGFRIAEEDLRLRGAGELLGVRQHGTLDLRVAEIARDGDLMEFAAEDFRSLKKTLIYCQWPDG
jgi:ATP-dependent DNA helicase RecG